MAGIEPSDIRKWTAIVESVHGINLAQGNSFVEPGEEFDDLLQEVVKAIRMGATTTGYNTYSNAAGVPKLREAIAKKCREFNHFPADPDPTVGTVTVTQGATGGLVCVLHAIADPGDEVILLSPFYGYHLKSLQMLGLHPKISAMSAPAWALDFAEIESLITDRTKAILINTPNNPTGKVFNQEELTHLCQICQCRGIALISDEVYEFITYDDAHHVSPASLPDVGSCVITVSSFSKTLAITGWRLGYVVADPELSHRIRIANEMLYVCAPTPLQHAIAPFVADWQRFTKLGPRFQKKRHLLCSALDAAGIRYEVPQGAYYVLGDFTGLNLGSDVAINLHLIEKYKVAGVPGAAFCENRPDTGTVRFCYAVMDSELRQLGQLLRT